MFLYAVSQFLLLEDSGVGVVRPRQLQKVHVRIAAYDVGLDFVQSQALSDIAAGRFALGGCRP